MFDVNAAIADATANMAALEAELVEAQHAVKYLHKLQARLRADQPAKPVELPSVSMTAPALVNTPSPPVAAGQEIPEPTLHESCLGYAMLVGRPFRIAEIADMVLARCHDKNISRKQMSVNVGQVLRRDTKHFKQVAYGLYDLRKRPRKRAARQQLVTPRPARRQGNSPSKELQLRENLELIFTDNGQSMRLADISQRLIDEGFRTGTLQQARAAAHAVLNKYTDVFAKLGDGVYALKKLLPENAKTSAEAA